MISFQVPTIGLGPIPITISLEAATVSECAEACFNNSLCTSANYEFGGAKIGRCHLSYSILQTCDATLPTVTTLGVSASVGGSVRILCPKCIGEYLKC